jgi:hypothetical protein
MEIDMVQVLKKKKFRPGLTLKNTAKFREKVFGSR